MSDINVTLYDASISVQFEWNATWPMWPSWSAGSSYVHNQSIPLALWTITHNLWSYPWWIVVVDSWDTNIVNFHITYVDDNTITLEFSWSTSGTAYLS